MRNLRNPLMIVAIITFGSAFAQSDQDIIDEVAVTCASSLATAGLLTDVKLSKMVLKRDAKWWFSALVVRVGQQQATDRVSSAMNELKDKWNSKETNWNELLDIGEKCSEMKLAVEGASE